MPRFFPFLFSPTRFFRSSIAPVAAFSLVGLTFGSGQIARADEFSVLPPSDPIVRQLAQLAPRTAPNAKPAASLTRYEAALQTARVILDIQSREAGTEAGTTSRAQWRAIDALCGSLKSELGQLGIDVEATRARAAKNLKNGAKTEAKIGDGAKNSPLVPRSSGFDGANTRFPRETMSRGAANSPAAANSRGAAGTLLTPELVADSSAGTLVSPGGANSKALSGALQMRLLPGLRVATDLQKSPRAGEDSLENGARFAPGLALRGASEAPGAESLAAQAALSYDLGRYLTLRAANSRLDWDGIAGARGENPLLGAPVFAGASGASGTGGGVDLNLGSGLKFSTEIERLRADTGAFASRIGGGASLSALQNRLLLQMSLSRLLPGDKGALTTTAAQLGASLDVSPRLSLNLRYQGLFAPAPNTSAARVAGGVSLSF